MADNENQTSRKHWLTRALTKPGVTISARAMVSFRVKYLNIAQSAADSLAFLELNEPRLTHWYDEAFMRASVAYLMSCMAVEACANEGLVGLELPGPLYRPIEKLPLITKMEAIAAFTGSEGLDRGSAVVQRLVLLIDIRNGLAHPKSEWLDDELSHATLSRKIEKIGIFRSPYSTTEDPSFPVACM
jgi:hypothetical protein